MQRPVFIFLWIVAVFEAWLVFWIGGFMALQRLDWSLSVSIAKTLPDPGVLEALFVSCVLFLMGLVGFLGLKSKLPGTEPKKYKQGSGFSVIHIAQSKDVESASKR